MHREPLRRNDRSTARSTPVTGLPPQRGFAPSAAPRGSEATTAAGSPIQRYFVINDQNTNDEGTFLSESDALTLQGNEKAAKLRENVWEWSLKAALLEGTGLKDSFLSQYKEKILDSAVDGTRYSFRTTCRQLQSVHAMQEEAKTPVDQRPSPTGMPTITGTTLSKPEKPKHSPTRYARSGGEETLIDLDDLTKDPARRARDSTPLPAPTVRQAWTRKEIKTAISVWTGEMPLVQHLAAVVFKRLGNTAEGRYWEVKMREFARVLDVRTTESQNLHLSIRSKEGEDIRSFTRSDYEVRARESVKSELLKEREPPATQSDLLFFDDLLRTELPNEWLEGQAGEQLSLNNQKAESPGSLSMTLTHWRTILYFDWYLGHDILHHSHH